MNKRGFGLGTMICLCGILGICLLTSAFTYHELVTGKKLFTLPKFKQDTVLYQMKNDYSGVSVIMNQTEYQVLENRLKEGAITYIESNQVKGENKIIITLHTLQNKKIIDSLYDSKRNACNGYVIYDLDSNYYFPYIRCGVYRTNDYVNHLE